MAEKVDWIVFKNKTDLNLFFDTPSIMDRYGVVETMCIVEWSVPIDGGQNEMLTPFLTLNRHRRVWSVSRGEVNG